MRCLIVDHLNNPDPWLHSSYRTSMLLWSSPTSWMLEIISCCESSNISFFFFRSVPEPNTKFSTQDLPCSLSQPVLESCRLYNGRVHGQYNFRRPPHLSHSHCKECFHSTTLVISLLLRRFTYVHLSKTYLPSKGFSLTVHYQTLTSPAAQGDLTTLPDIALSMGLRPSSVKSFMAQTMSTKILC